MAGYNIERWRWSEAAQQWSHLDESLDENLLLDHFKSLSETGAYILQPSAKHHSFFDGMSEGGVCTLRILSLCSVDQEIELVFNYVGIPAGDSPINHGPRGGLKVKMNLESHCLENLVWSKPTLGVSTTHPVTGEQIYGKRLDWWPEVEAFVKAAHLAFRWLGILFIRQREFKYWRVTLSGDSSTVVLWGSRITLNGLLKS